MKRNSVSPQSKTKTKSINKSPSQGLTQFISQQYPQKIPIAAITAAHKYFGKGKPLKKDDRIIKRIAGNQSEVSTSTLLDLLNSQETHQKGKPLSEEAVKRVYQSFVNPQGKLSFEFLMKMGESTGVTINEKMAKLIVKKYGKRKDHMTVQDCLNINARRSVKSQSKSLAKK